jgi:ribonuclease HII
MVMCILAVEDESILHRMGAKDSKQLSPQERERLAEMLRDAADRFPHEIVSLSPQDIDAAVLGKGHGDNLNHLEARTTALLISRLAKRAPVSEVIVDSPERNMEKYTATVTAALHAIDPSCKVKIRCEIRADANHPVVGAASILAKVTRDEAIAALAKSHGPMGSGYPADPLTQAFLRAHHQEPHAFFRKSWESYQALTRNQGQSSLDAFGGTADPAGAHKEVIDAFEVLREHGFAFAEPTNPYEVVRMKDAMGIVIIRYTTGKLQVQGPEPARTGIAKLVERLGLGAPSRPRGRPRKT